LNVHAEIPRGDAEIKIQAVVVFRDAPALEFSVKSFDAEICRLDRASSREKKQTGDRTSENVNTFHFDTPSPIATLLNDTRLVR